MDSCPPLCLYYQETHSILTAARGSEIRRCAVSHERKPTEWKWQSISWWKCSVCHHPLSCQLMLKDEMSYSFISLTHLQRGLNEDTVSPSPLLTPRLGKQKKKASLLHALWIYQRCTFIIINQWFSTHHCYFSCRLIYLHSLICLQVIVPFLRMARAFLWQQEWTQIYWIYPPLNLDVIK